MVGSFGGSSEASALTRTEEIDAGRHAARPGNGRRPGADLWVLYNIGPSTTSIGLGAGANPPSGTSGLNDYGTLGYGGPCPPVGDGAHHYRFTISALDTVLTGMATGAFITFNMLGHIIAQGTYIGLFAR